MGPQDNATPTATEREPATLLVSFELSRKNWVLTIQHPQSGKLSRVAVAPCDTGHVLEVVRKHRQQAEQRIGGPVRIVSVYEAGLDGFWLHRWLMDQDIESQVVDAASILGPRRRRNAKSDRIDGEKMVRSLALWCSGDRQVCRMVVPPSAEHEDVRRLSRERGELVSERNRLSNRIGGLLANQGVVDFKPMQKGAEAALETLCTGDGRALMANLKASIARMLQRLALLKDQIKAVEAERDQLLQRPQTDATAVVAAADDEIAMAQRLLRLRGIGAEFATVLPAECLYKRFDNRRQIGAFAGLAPTPWSSGSIEREQGISKAGNRRLRKTMVELAWSWTRHQPGSALTRWFNAKVAGQGKRVRRIAIVALARKLLVALWRYVQDGVVPDGAVLKE
jgi:transposase